ncbi:MAG: hypothetical protein IKN38_05955 [Clostridia bacterium]|nr:hypothetical protein [Clostridia bacterium]
MENNMEISREEMEKLIEKAKRDLEETLSKMTPEERAAAEERAKKAIAEDEAKRQKLLDDAARILGKTEPAAQKRPKFCSNCGAAAGAGNFCEFCGSPLKI